jgi:hypothetical protein
MNTMTRAALWIVKVATIGIVFFACFGATLPVVMLMTKVFPQLPFLLQVLPIIPMMLAANRFILSPLEYYLKVKSLQYDPWYERRRMKQDNQR